ncbi:triose-phosphate isomerase [Candidatus Woesearchaeota archaeon]|nr:MAG: triose-phosphate isomerase [Candidatus Woesearchaeota archaeon]
MEYPVIIVNFKTYKESTAETAVKLAKICEKVAKKTKKNIIVAVQHSDIYRVSQAVKIPVFAQHVDTITAGAHTGHILAETVKQNGAVGTLINHSEHTLALEVIQQTIARAKEAGLFTVVCAHDAKLAEKIAKFSPGCIAVEPPDLIGGKVSVSTAKPELIKNTVEKVNKVAAIPVLCGAGVQNSQDVKIALQLGSKGILLASGVVKAENPEQVLLDLVSVL